MAVNKNLLSFISAAPEVIGFLSVRVAGTTRTLFTFISLIKNAKFPELPTESCRKFYSENGKVTADHRSGCREPMPGVRCGAELARI